MTLKVVTSGTASGAVAEFVPVLIADKVASRIAAKDFTLWGKDAESESSIRLGWVNSAEDSAPLVESILALREYKRFSNAILITEKTSVRQSHS